MDRNNPLLAATARIPGERFLHSLGPTHIPAEVLNAMHRQPMDHGDPRLDEIIAVCEAGLRRLLGTEKAALYMYAANGHGTWEATTQNLLAPGEAFLIPGTGHFSEQWALQAEALGRRAIRTPYREGYPIDPNEVEQRLRADRKREIAAVFVVHTDTASGISNDLKSIRAAIDAAGHPALLVVDVVASLAAAPFAMDGLGVNVAVGASQKGLMSPPGLGFVAVDERAGAVAARNPAPRHYWDWERRKATYSYQKFGGTPHPLVTIAYTAVILANASPLSMGTPKYDRAVLTAPGGFNGRDGVFRFLNDGRSQYALVIKKVQAGGATVVEGAKL